MKPTIKLDSTSTPDGGELGLYQHDRDFEIKINGQLLMSSRQHESELALARFGCTHLYNPIARASFRSSRPLNCSGYRTKDVAILTACTSATGTGARRSFATSGRSNFHVHFMILLDAGDATAKMA